MREVFLAGVTLGLSVEGQVVASGHRREGLAQGRHCMSKGTWAGPRRMCAGPRASVYRLRAEKAVGDETGRVGWRQMLEKEL